MLATNNFLWVELHRLYTPWIQEATKANYYQTILAPSAPVNFLMELCWPSLSFTLRHWQLLSITDILLTVSAIGITLLNTSLAHSQDFQKRGLGDPAWEWVREGGLPLQNGPGDNFTGCTPHTYYKRHGHDASTQALA